MGTCVLGGANRRLGAVLRDSLLPKHSVLLGQRATFSQSTIHHVNKSGRRDLPVEAAAPERTMDSAAAVKSYEEMPGPKPLPIIGNAWRFAPLIGEFYGMELQKMHSYIADKYGLISKITRVPGMFDMVIAFRPEDAEVVFRNEGQWPSRGGLRSLQYYRSVTRKDFYEGSSGVLVEDGEKWLDSRKKVNPAMIQPRISKKYVPPIAGVAQEFVDRIQTLRDNKDELPSDFINELFKWSLESIAYVALDARLGCLAPNLHPDSEPQKMINAAGDFFECLYYLEIGVPMWKIFPTPSWKRYIRGLDVFVDVSKKYVDEAMERTEKQKKGVEEREPSVLERLLARSDVKTATVMAQDMLLAGIDSTSYSVAMVMYQLSKNQDKQALLFDELKRFLPNKDDPITEENLENMKYLKACMKETFRVSPIVSRSVRFTVKEIVLSNYKIPAGVAVVMPNTLSKSSEKMYPQSQRFIPERWLKLRPTELTTGNVEDFDAVSRTKHHPFSFLPFGFGPRSCVGRRFAEMEVEILVAKMVRNFQIEYNYGEMKFVSRILNIPKDPLRFKLTERV